MTFKSIFGTTLFTMRLFEDSDESLECFAYPGALQDRWVAGLSLRVDPRSREPWVGHFLAGNESPNAIILYCDHPDGNHLVAVSKGVAYIVDIEQPEKWSEISLRPIMGMCISLVASQRRISLVA